jgi:hypothetical protein
MTGEKKPVSRKGRLSEILPILNLRSLYCSCLPKGTNVAGRDIIVNQAFDWLLEPHLPSGTQGLKVINARSTHPMKKYCAQEIGQRGLRICDLSFISGIITACKRLRSLSKLIHASVRAQLEATMSCQTAEIILYDL